MERKRKRRTAPLLGALFAAALFAGCGGGGGGTAQAPVDDPGGSGDQRALVWGTGTWGSGAFGSPVAP